jgi:ABC-type sugar transport system substrate-binding protein
VKVISYDRLIRETDAVDYYVTFDSISVGEAQAQYLVDNARARQPAVPVRRGGVGQQRLPVLRRGLERAAAEDCRRHVLHRELQRR